MKDLLIEMDAFLKHETNHIKIESIHSLFNIDEEDLNIYDILPKGYINPTIIKESRKDMEEKFDLFIQHYKEMNDMNDPIKTQTSILDLYRDTVGMLKHRTDDSIEFQWFEVAENHWTLLNEISNLQSEINRLRGRGIKCQSN
jgi:hypothetical protein